MISRANSHKSITIEEELLRRWIRSWSSAPVFYIRFPPMVSLRPVIPLRQLLVVILAWGIARNAFRAIFGISLSGIRKSERKIFDRPVSFDKGGIQSWR